MNAIELAHDVRELLAINPQLSSSDRKILETLLLTRHPLTARELSRGTRSNLQALYGALDGLEARGLVVRERHATVMTFRIAHPSVVLDEILGPWKRGKELAVGIEGPLRDLYESPVAPPPSRSSSSHAMATDSLTAASSWLIERLRSSEAEIWFFGTEEPWFQHSPRIESELATKKASCRDLKVRLLVRAPNGDERRRAHHSRLRTAGLDVRYSPRFEAPAVVVDRSSMFLRTTSRSPGSGPVYVRLEAADLCGDWISAGEREWTRSTST